MSERIEKLRKARSINEVAAILKQVAADVTKYTKMATKFVASLSAGGDAEITIDRSGKGNGPVARKSSKTNKSLTHIKLEKFIAPNTKELAKHTDVISKLFENSRELETAIAVVEQGFSGNKHQATTLKAIKLLQKDVDASLNNAFAALGDIAEKHIPSQIEEAGDSVIDYLNQILPEDAYDEISKYVYVGAGADKSFIFSLYVGIQNLKSSKGFQFDTFYIVLTGVVKGGVLSMFINSAPDFKAPGKYNKGYPLSDNKTAARHVSEFLAQNDVKLELSRQAFPLNNERVKTSGMDKIAGVEKMGVKDDALWITLKGTVEQAKKKEQEVITAVMARLHSLLNMNRRSSGLSYKAVTRNGKRILQFILLNKGGSKKLNRAVVEDLQQVFGLTDRQVQQLREAQRDIE